MRGNPRRGYTVVQSADTSYPLIGSFLETGLPHPHRRRRLFPYAIKILSFQNFYKVLKTCSAGRKGFFDTLLSPFAVETGIIFAIIFETV